jgi:hypothetical protein
MPLIKGKSKGAFEHNMKAEMHAGKPQKQALAIAYATKRRAMKAHGGYMAEGGQITDNHQSTACEYCTMDGATQMEHSPECQTQSHDEDMLHQGKESFPAGAYHMADGGEPDPTEQQPDESAMGAGMVDRIMAKRMSEGGRVANEDHGPMDSRLADFDQNEFDDLALRDDLESSYTGANSGDEKGDAQEDDDRKDIVARIMKSRGKKDRMPR